MICLFLLFSEEHCSWLELLELLTKRQKKRVFRVAEDAQETHSGMKSFHVSFILAKSNKHMSDLRWEHI